MLTGGESEGTALWHAPAANRPTVPAAADLPKLWDALAGEKPLPAWAAIAKLAAGGAGTAYSRSAAQFLGQRLPKPGAADPDVSKKVAELVKALDDPAFKRREKAAKELKALGRQIHRSRRPSRRPKSVEVRRQLKARGRCPGLAVAPVPVQDLQAFRALAAVERIGGPAAAMVLQQVADSGAEGAGGRLPKRPSAASNRGPK